MSHVWEGHRLKNAAVSFQEIRRQRYRRGKATGLTDTYLTHEMTSQREHPEYDVYRIPQIPQNKALYVWCRHTIEQGGEVVLREARHREASKFGEVERRADIMWTEGNTAVLASVD